MKKEKIAMPQGYNDNSKRFKKDINLICTISLGNRFRILSEESLETLVKLNIKENDFVIFSNPSNNVKLLGKILSKKPYLSSKLTKDKQSIIGKNLIIKKANLWDRFLDKIGGL